MQIIPVLDIKGGLVVRGVMGNRAEYRPIETPLSAGPEPVAVARGLATLADFPAFYIADLDAIEGRAPPDAAVVAALAEAFPGKRFWVDAGVRTAADVQAVAALPQSAVVIGTESVSGSDVVAGCRDNPEVVLSLDFRGDAFLGPPELAADASLWPQRVIVMTLAKVGSGAGPDMDRLREVKAMAGAREVFAAGGVRGPEDLARLSTGGMAGALVATALHDGRLGREVLARGSGG
ncbi:HisA/HisF-related TIM barrel protein [Jiella sp. M17.18]|uniref:HisA/HisF-related TIM barrel protein n=1 Tax=Jiella sp. M17.18 TaxID=3234247 RepID=UPI0034DE43FF